MWAWILHVTGVEIGPHGNHWANFWQGFGSDFGELALIAGLGAAWHKHSCHQERCWRLSRHIITDADGVTHGACRKHRTHVVAKVNR